jgi:hypothetical protein
MGLDYHVCGEDHVAIGTEGTILVDRAHAGFTRRKLRAEVVRGSFARVFGEVRG